MPVLVVGGRRRPVVVPLDREPVSVGRSSENDVQLDHPDVSRYQCRFEALPDGGHRVKDLRSTNGTYLNGERIRTMALEEGDQIIVGQVTIIYAADDADPRAELERVGGLFPWKPTSTGEHTAVRPHSPRVLAQTSRMEVTGPTRRQPAPNPEAHATHPLRLQELLPHIARCGQSVESDIDLGNLLLTILTEILRHTAFERAVLLLYDEQTKLAQPVLSRNVIYEHLAPEVQHFVSRITKEAVLEQAPLFRCGSVLDFEGQTTPFPMDSAVESVLCIPLTAATRRAAGERRRHHRRRQTLGVFYLDSGRVIDEVDEYEQELIEALAAQACTALQQAQLHYQATTDPMTRLSNRVGMWQLLQDEIQWAQDHQAPLAVILLDLDHFKRINDAHGHPAGDEVLKRLARRISRVIRTDDCACRWGGEEFLILVPGVPRDGVLRVTRKIAEAISETPIGEKRLWITASMGVALYPGHGVEPSDLIRRADTALYHAKTSGRNATCIFDATQPVMLDDRGYHDRSGSTGGATGPGETTWHPA